MRAGIAAVIIGVSVVNTGMAWSACTAGKLRNCIDLDLVPQISQQIVAGEPITAAPKTVPAVQTAPAYTGPTVGAAANLRRAPTVGYRWSLE